MDRLNPRPDLALTPERIQKLKKIAKELGLYTWEDIQGYWFDEDSLIMWSGVNYKRGNPPQNYYPDLHQFKALCQKYDFKLE